jgi:hypothetical protein
MLTNNNKTILYFSLSTGIIKGLIVYLKQLEIYSVVKDITINSEGYKLDLYNTPNLNPLITIGGMDIVEIQKVIEVSGITPLDLLYDHYNIDKVLCKYYGQPSKVLDVYYDSSLDCYWCTLITLDDNVRNSFRFESIAEFLDMVEVGNERLVLK